jgi:hypothetical protein
MDVEKWLESKDIKKVDLIGLRDWSDECYKISKST